MRHCQVMEEIAPFLLEATLGTPLASPSDAEVTTCVANLSCLAWLFNVAAAISVACGLPRCVQKVENTACDSKSAA